MYHINSRLNAISRHVAGYLHGDPGGWKVPAFTSGWAPLYKDFVNQKGGADGAKAALEAMRNAG